MVYRVAAAAFFAKRSRALIKESRTFTRKTGLLVKTDDITIHRDSDLPPLAWICHIDIKGVRFDIGNQVEQRGNLLFEGAWNGSFQDSSPEKSDFVFGSGAIIGKQNICFVTPKHSLESVFVLFDHQQKKLSVSNSMAFLLSRAQIKKNSRFMKLLDASIEESSSRAAESGVDRYKNVIVKNEEHSLLRMTYFNFTINSGGVIKPRWQPVKKYFTSFLGYESLLTRVMKSLIENTADAARLQRYSPISAVSQGYDSVAVSSLAKSCGVSRSVTLDVTVYGINDSGHKIAQQLGMSVDRAGHLLTSEIDRMDVRLAGDMAKKAFEFIATDGIGDDVAFLGFEKSIKNSLYFSGTYGDVVWKKTKEVRNGLPKKVFERSITEYRLRTGFINVPLISVGARHSAPVQKITNSQEMIGAYSVGGDYDRPIPRRIAEEAGVDRSLFGVKKNATSPVIANRDALFCDAMDFIMKRYV
jgi:hypothetical protein